MPAADETQFPLDRENIELGYARDIVLQTGHSVFLTGKAGTGKSTFLRSLCETTSKKRVVLAPTGIAAINVRGETIHSFFQFPFGPLLPGDERIDELRYRKDKRKLMRELELLIVDEVSMVRADLLDAMDQVLRRVREREAAFGGVQLLLVGDLFQLEPVTVRSDWEPLSVHYDTPYFFSARALRYCDLVNIELEKVYRQSDPVFIGLLNRIRCGQVAIDDLVALNRRPSHPPYSDRSPVVHLTGRRAAAEDFNKRRLEELGGDARSFEGIVSGEFPVRHLPTDSDLDLRIGAQVMFVRNEGPPFRRWVNGTVGTLSAFDEGGVQVELENGHVVPVSVVTWEHIKYRYDPSERRILEEVVGSFSQLPLRLAWAITIHKSQGLTFQRLSLDLGGGAFAAGQLYVALSRATALEGLFLRRKIRRSDVIVRPEVVEYYARTNDLEQIRRVLGKHGNA